MLQALLQLLPDRVNQMPLALAAAIAGGALLLGLAGARFSRSILTLALVATGTILGLHMPRWFGWGIDSMGTAFGAAILLGLSGFILTSLWEGIIFGTMLALAAGTAVWMSLAAGATLHWPGLDWSSTAVEMALKIYQALPPTINRTLPVAIVVGFGIGSLLVALWPRLGRVLLYSVLGMGIFVMSGALALRSMKPDWMAALTTDPWIQGAVFAWIVLLAAGAQWFLLPRARKPRPRQDSERDSTAMRGSMLEVREARGVFSAERKTNDPADLVHLEPDDKLAPIIGPRGRSTGIRPQARPATTK